MASARGSRAERDDDLVLFHEMQRREREKKHSLPMRPVAENQHSDPNHGQFLCAFLSPSLHLILSMVLFSFLSSLDPNHG